MRTATNFTQRPNVPRMLVGAIIAIAAIIAGLALMVVSPSPQSKPAIEIHDDANLVEEEALAQRLGNISFWEPVKNVAVLTLPDLHGMSLNDAVLEYARTEKNQPWIKAEDRNYWSDGLYILAVAPNERLVGTYFGEDIKLSLDTQADIQETTKDQFRSGDWAGGLVSGVEAGAKLMGRPAMGSPAFTIFFAAISFMGAAWLVVLVIRKSRTTHALDEARTSYANVTRDFETTEIAAKTIPSTGGHAAIVLERFTLFHDKYHELSKAFNDFGAPTGLALYTTVARNQARSLRSEAQHLDATDDGIIGAADFLSHTGAWQQSWANEQGPVFEDLAALETLIDNAPKDISQEALREARMLLADVPQALALVSQELQEKTLQPEQALDRLKDIENEIRIAAESLVNEALDSGKSKSERKSRRKHWDNTNWDDHAGYSGSWSFGGSRGSYSPGSTILPNASTLGWSRSATAATVPVAGLVVGYTAARAAAASSSSGSSGSSSYSGGFSGSGSSSSF